MTETDMAETDKAETDETETRVIWFARTLGYVMLAAIMAVILTNAVQSFFLERIVPGVSSGVAGGVSAVIALRRRKRLAPATKSETNS